MPETQSGKGPRRKFAVALCLALFLSFSPLAAVAGQVFQSAVSSCCPANGKASCPRHHSPNSETGLAFSSVCCMRCGAGDDGAMNATVMLAAPSTATFSAMSAAGRIAASGILPGTRIPSHSLRQRPPPASLV